MKNSSKARGAMAAILLHFAKTEIVYLQPNKNNNDRFTDYS